MKKSWTLDDVFMLENSELYVPKSLDNPQDLQDNDSDGTVFVRNETLFSLGEALLELKLQESRWSPPTRRGTRRP
jgi:hypothetical protein